MLIGHIPEPTALIICFSRWIDDSILLGQFRLTYDEFLYA